MKHWKLFGIGFASLALAIVSYALLAELNVGVPASSRASDSPPAFDSSPRRRTAVVPAGTKVCIRFLENTRPRDAVAGVHFTALLQGPLIVGNELLAPSRSKIIGQFVAAAPEQAPGTASAMVLRKIVIGNNEYGLDTRPVIWRSIPSAPGAGVGVTGVVEGAEAELRTITYRERGLVEKPSAAGVRNGERSEQRGRLAIPQRPESGGSELRLLFTLSAPIELPVIRTLGGHVIPRRQNFHTQGIDGQIETGEPVRSGP